MSATDLIKDLERLWNQFLVELKPLEPNSYDSLGEVLLLAGRYDQAESAFAKSAEMAPDNWMSWIGVSGCRPMYSSARSIAARSEGSA